jgi:toxin CptA
MPERDPRLVTLLSDDPEHFYSERELDAIEALDAEMALRIDRAQVLSARAAENSEIDSDAPVDALAVAGAIEEARSILARDGGDLELVEIRDRIVRVRMKGACVGCPNAPLDLKNVVERLIRSRVPGVRRVVNAF